MTSDRQPPHEYSGRGPRRRPTAQRTSERDEPSGRANLVGGYADALAPLERRLAIVEHGLIGAYDLSSSAAVQAHITEVFARVGVTKVVVEPGEKFDPSASEAVSTVPTEESHRVARVAQTVRPGWQRRDGVLRVPQVSVWTAIPSRPQPSAPGFSGEPTVMSGE